MKKSFRPFFYVILIIILAGAIISYLNSSGIKDRVFPNTTFKKEVIEKIENKEISSLLLMEWTGSENVVILKNKADIDYIMDSLAPLKFKKVSKIPDTSIDNYDIIIKDQGKSLFSFSLYGSKYMMISDFEKNSVQRYEVANDIDLNQITKFLENENK